MNTAPWIPKLPANVAPRKAALAPSATCPFQGGQRAIADHELVDDEMVDDELPDYEMAAPFLVG